MDFFSLFYELPGTFLRALKSPVAKDTLPEEYAREVLDTLQRKV
jgi:hypothetical protein